MRGNQLAEAEDVECGSVVRKKARPAVVRKPGDVIAEKYVLVQVLGRGGMGSVWHARHLTLGTDVAIKLILPSLLTDEASERLLREARAAAVIDHPSIVRVFDFGRTAEGEPFIVMELLRGATLADLLVTRGRLPPRVAVQLLLPVASALAVAHAQGVVHRDLKPDNVMLVVTAQGDVLPKLVDFGIAKLLREDTALTRVGAVMGSPSYMSPEQARGAAQVDERADVWGLTVVLYEAITGMRPFEAENYHALLYTILHDDPVSTLDLSAGDAELCAIVKKGMEKDAGARFRTMRELGARLAEWAVARGVDVDVTGSQLDHCWLAPARSERLLDLSAVAPRASLEPTEWSPSDRGRAAEMAAAEQAPTVTLAPASTASHAPAAARRAPAAPRRLGLALLGAALAAGLIAATWWGDTGGEAAPPPVVSAPAQPMLAALVEPAPPAEPRVVPAVPAVPAPTDAPAVAPPPTASAVAPHSPAAHRPSAAGPRASRRMPLPTVPDF